MHNSKWLPISIYLAIVIISLVAVVVIHAGNDVEINFLIYTATVALAAIAYVELHKANQINKNEILIFISDRWSSNEIIVARQIIHEIFVYRYRYDKALNSSEDFKIAMQNASTDIYDMSKNMSDEGRRFVYLLNLLDHFESVSYLCMNDKIELADIQNIYGNNMVFYYEVFEKYIKQRQSHIKVDFLNYSKMYNALKNSNLDDNQAIK